ncbi:MAG: lipase family protein [Actinomycetota bacterium]|nr:lipase family protein [Actinomycetota bacterium]
MRRGQVALVAMAVAVLVVGGIALGRWDAAEVDEQQAQAALDPFYTPPSPIPAVPGTLIRSEPLGVEVPGAEAVRLLYATERPDGTPAVSGAFAVIPGGPTPAGGRPVVAWAHGTVGMGEACAASRTTDPLAGLDVWLDEMVGLGWIVVGTDYAGLGTPGPELYLVAEAEARDVVNSVRAVRSLPGSGAGTQYAVWGHSQGGHSSLWTGHLGPVLAPELDLVGVAAAAPAARLVEIMGAQWDTTVGWGIGPEVLVSWPAVDTSLEPAQAATSTGLDNYQRIAQECTSDLGLAVELVAREKFGEKFFTADPTSQPAWREFADAQTPPPMPAEMPVFLAQGTADEVVLAWPNAILEKEWCAAGSSLTTLWLGDIGHLAAAKTAGPAAVQWIAERFAGRPAADTCGAPTPVAPQAPIGSAA